MGEQANLIGKIIDRTAAAIESNKEHLTRLDQLIGDGDHGINMSRGFSAILEKRGEIAALPFDEACKKAGMLLVMTVGGASGPLFGSCIMAIGKGRNAVPSSRPELAAMLAEGVDAIKSRGKSDVGAKTMLDVLAPVTDYIANAAPFSLDGLRQTAAQALEATKPIEATKGRAAFLGARSIGHIDPGAQTVTLLVNSISDALEQRP
jgi:dihydroxyacetone kinase-like protein